jgi:natural product biosynthesis luciferase-like monooxygenase protein
MEFGIMFFSNVEPNRRQDKYRLLMKATEFADQHGFCCVWTPERHFHGFGGLFPNPSVLSAALAMITDRLQIRAGSLISPLHDAVRIAEDWSIIDNLSGGRAAISFGSGWNIDDFVFHPERYATRQAIMFQQIEVIKKLWSGGHIVSKNCYEKEVRVSISPKPIQHELPIWITSSRSVETFNTAGAIGANDLTHMIGQDIDTLESKIRSYRMSRLSNGHDPASGKVSLMLHTFIGTDDDRVREIVRSPFRDYLRSAIDLEARSAKGGGVISGGLKIDPHDIAERTMDELLDIAFDRYWRTASLLGTPARCSDLLWQLIDIGVDEIACLIDFLDDEDAIMESLAHLSGMRDAHSGDSMSGQAKQAARLFQEKLDSD